MMSPRRPLPRLRSLATALAALALVAVGTGAAHAGDGAQFSGDCFLTYINKKVGDTEQWAITWDGITASGNVFKLDGSAPSFIECLFVSEDDTNEVLDCYGSSACSAPQCGGSQWTKIASSVTIPRTFFYPPGVDVSAPDDSCESGPQQQ